jgi:hypothetical protein
VVFGGITWFTICESVLAAAILAFLIAGRLIEGV